MKRNAKKKTKATTRTPFLDSLPKEKQLQAIRESLTLLSGVLTTAILNAVFRIVQQGQGGDA